mmetsp:Transcript_33469/g.48524  ORF Transcript_33469/g.48524 Transcript_33469/m.48524 type:complete len:102 (-) Transcript_33469:793-1098(-)
MESKIYGRCLHVGCQCQIFCEDETLKSVCKYCNCSSSEHFWAGIMSNGVPRWFNYTPAPPQPEVSLLPAINNRSSPDNSNNLTNLSNIQNERSNIFKLQKT